MGLNKNHESEEFNGVKCAVVEKNVSKERAAFLRQILEFNSYQVEVSPVAPPKPKATPVPPVPTSAETVPETPVANAAPVAETPAPEPEPTAFNVGVTDLMFNPINAVFGRLLKSAGGHVVTLAYWNQKDQVSHDEVPYFGNKETWT